MTLLERLRAAACVIYAVRDLGAGEVRSGYETLVFLSLAPAIPGMENKMPDKNSKEYQWEKKLTASFNFEGALEVAAAAAALAQGREELVSGADGNLPSWYRDPAKTGRDGAAKTIGFYRPKDQPKTPKVRYFLGITENSKDKQGSKIGISLEYPDLFKIVRVMEEAALAILGWRKDIEGRREPNGHDRSAKGKAQTAEAF